MTEFINSLIDGIPGVDYDMMIGTVSFSGGKATVTFKSVMDD